MRKPDPDRIYLARRAAQFRRLADEDHLDKLDAEHWIAGWEREADGCGINRHSDAFWEEGTRWIAERRRTT
jgi:hypothetical protein